jgi:acyl dehydratase
MATRVVRGIDELRSLVGQDAGTSEWMTITQDLIKRFAEVSGDHQWIHLDVERARTESPYGTTIAHGFLTVSLLSVLVKQAVQLQGDFKMSVNYGFNRLRFTGAVPAGSRIRAQVTPLGVKDVTGGYEITWGVTIEVEGQTKPALVAEWLGRTYVQ